MKDGNNNAALIPALREAAAYLEAHPDIPALTICWLAAQVSTLDQLRAGARAMGSFEKVPDDNYYRLVRRFGPLSIETSIPRGYICKKVVTYECPEDIEVLLNDLGVDSETADKMKACDDYGTGGRPGRL